MIRQQLQALTKLTPEAANEAEMRVRFEDVKIRIDWTGPLFEFRLDQLPPADRSAIKEHLMALIRGHINGKL